MSITETQNMLHILTLTTYFDVKKVWHVTKKDVANIIRNSIKINPNQPTASNCLHSCFNTSQLNSDKPYMVWIH